jgi:hypothetical protein
MSSPGLTEFKRLLVQANEERAAITRDLSDARGVEQQANKRYASWRDGWLLRHVFKSRFAKLETAAEEATARRLELEEQLKLARVETQLEIEPTVLQRFSRLSDDFAALAAAERIWDTVGERAANRVAERTTASRVVERRPVRFRLGACDLIESEFRVPHLQNANGGDIFLYPIFAIYFVASDNFALMEYSQISLDTLVTRFIEEETVPREAKVVAQT